MASWAVRSKAVLGVALLLAGVLVAGRSPAPAAAAIGAPSGFSALPPARLLDTRPGAATVDGAGARAAALGPQETYDLPVLGRGGVPGSGVAAVVLNVTATEPTAAGFLTVWAAGAEQPLASSLNFVPGQTVPNLVLAQVGADGAVSLFNSAGRTHLVVDVAGWFAVGAAYAGVAPARLLDTRPGTATIDGRMRTGLPIGPDAILNVPVAGRGGVPATGAGAVVLNLTATEPTAAGYLAAYPTGDTRPLASSLNFTPGQTVANLAVVALGAGGQVTLYNPRGATDVVLDVAGWFPAGAGFAGVQPARLADTRPAAVTIDGQGAPGAPLGPGGELELVVTGRGGVPSTGVGAVVLNVTATEPTATGYVTAWPAGTPRPLASSLNVVPGRAVANLVVAKVGEGGGVALYNDAGDTHLVVDVAGWFADGEGGGATGGGADPRPAPGAVVAPSPPREVRADVVGTSIVLSFESPASDGGSPVTGYAATCTPLGGGAAAAVSAFRSPITITGLGTGTHRCTVAASNAVATSVGALAPEVSVTGAPTVPAAPTGVSAVADGNRARVTFTPSASNGGRPITQYAATCSSTDGGTRRTGRGASSPITVTRLTHDRTYFCRVVAINSVGESPLSPPSALITTD